MGKEISQKEIFYKQIPFGDNPKTRPILFGKGIFSHLSLTDIINKFDCLLLAKDFHDWATLKEKEGGGGIERKRSH